METRVQELSDGTLVFFIDIRNLPKEISDSRNALRIYLAQFKEDIEGKI